MRYAYLKSTKRKKDGKIIFLSSLSLVIGTLTLLWSFYPIIAFSLGKIFTAKRGISPLPQKALASSLQKGMVIYDDNNAPYYSSYLKDFTNVADWFPKQKQRLLTRKDDIKEYKISIPKIGITDAIVKVGAEDLVNSLVQYGNKVLPGESGNASILGHSTLPQLYKRGDYKTVFTYLPTLESGDKIEVSIGGFTYQYVVYDMFVVKPEETSVLEEKGEEPILSIITCVPPGTYWERLVVRAKLLKI
jgi:sortase A